MLNERGYYPSGARPSEAQHLDVSRNRFAQPLGSVGGPRSPVRSSNSRPPFYSPGKGEGPVGSMSLDARYGALNSAGGHAAHNDKLLFFDEDLHQNIDVADDPVGGTTLSWPSLGGEHMGNRDRYGPDAVASSQGLYDPYSSRVDENKKISPSQWPEEAGYTRGSAIARRKEKVRGDGASVASPIPVLFTTISRISAPSLPSAPLPDPDSPRPRPFDGARWNPEISRPQHGAE